MVILAKTASCLETDLPAGLGRVANDAGVLSVGDAHYIVSFMSIGKVRQQSATY